MEQQLHCTLFVRTNRGIQLTPEGEKEFCAMQERFRKKLIDRDFKTLEILNTLQI